jgi:lysozyme family protein
MADFKKMIPFIIKWETGVSLKMGESNEALFRRAKASKSGFVDDPDDRGGATVLGVTIGTFSNYMAKKGVRSVTVNDLKNLSYEDWLSILKKMYWDRWHADDIKSQSVAEVLVDWIWASGKWGVIIPQRMLGVTDDGIVGVMTLDALNKKDPKDFFDALIQERISFVEDIVKKTPSQKKFLNGWKNRINDLKFES